MVQRWLEKVPKIFFPNWWFTLPKFNSEFAPEKWWQRKTIRLPIGWNGNFSGAKWLNFGRVMVMNPMVGSEKNHQQKRIKQTKVDPIYRKTWNGRCHHPKDYRNRHNESCLVVMKTHSRWRRKFLFLGSKGRYFFPYIPYDIYEFTFVFWMSLVNRYFLQGKRNQIYQVIQVVTFLSPIAGGHSTVEWVTFSPSQKWSQRIARYISTFHWYLAAATVTRHARHQASQRTKGCTEVLGQAVLGGSSQLLSG